MVAPLREKLQKYHCTGAFIGKWRGKGGACAERDVTQEGSREQTRQSVMVGGSWVKKRNFNAT